MTSLKCFEVIFTHLDFLLFVVKKLDDGVSSSDILDGKSRISTREGKFSSGTCTKDNYLFHSPLRAVTFNKGLHLRICSYGEK